MSEHAWTSAGLSVIAIWGLIAGLALGSAALLIAAWFAFLLMLWLAAHNPRRWERPEDWER